MDKDEPVKYMSDPEIVEFIKYYIDKSSYNYAVLIDGSWGCGKTFFIKNVIKPSIEAYEKSKTEDDVEYKERKIIYTSLYGITSKDEITRSLWLETFPLGKFVKSKTGKIVSNIGKVFIGGFLSSKGISLPETSLESGDFTSLENCILIFDDLERCGMDINEVLGYINNFVEHDEIKVIIVANEKEISTINLAVNKELKYIVALSQDIIIPEEDSNSNPRLNLKKPLENNQSKKLDINELAKRVDKMFGEDKLYKQIKEKLIGVNIHYKPDVAEIVDNVTHRNITDERIRKIIVDNIEFVVEKFNRDHPNIRTLLFCFDKFNTLAASLLDSKIELQDLENILTDILKYMVVVSILYKSGKSLPKWQENTEIEYKSIDGEVYGYIKGFKFVDHFISEANFPKSKVIDVIKRHIEISKSKMQDPNDPLYILSKNYWLIDDKRASELMTTVNQALSDPKKYDTSCYSEILFLNITLSSIGVVPDEVQEIVKKMKDNIKSLKVKKTFNTFGMTRSFGEAEESERLFYAEYMKSLNDFLENYQKETDTNIINSILDHPNSWSDKLCQHVLNNDTNFFIQKGFISLLEFDKLCYAIKNSSSLAITDFRGLILDFYKSSNINEFFSSDKEPIDRLVKELQDYLPQIENTEKIKSSNIRYLIKDLKNISKRLGGQID